MAERPTVQQCLRQLTALFCSGPLADDVEAVKVQSLSETHVRVKRLKDEISMHSNTAALIKLSISGPDLTEC